VINIISCVVSINPIFLKINIIKQGYQLFEFHDFVIILYLITQRVFIVKTLSFCRTKNSFCRTKLHKEKDDLNGVVIGYADCYSKGPGFEPRVTHGPFQKFSIELTIQSCKKINHVSNDPYAELGKSSTYSHTWLGLNPQIGRPLSRLVVPLV
jgi:hypothetical protein